ncbi:hypothetical protein DFR67_105165 [Williamsia limnetica]|uniref:Uncharacterized protein n=1 Tax=Williamsia limnetica TaxID=882452 RepID=A0A318RJJ5_WILLI|nr:hypothetical protein DFR67_105165 [Williamsia limnetica]
MGLGSGSVGVVAMTNGPGQLGQGFCDREQCLVDGGHGFGRPLGGPSARAPRPGGTRRDDLRCPGVRHLLCVVEMPRSSTGAHLFSARLGIGHRVGFGRGLPARRGRCGLPGGCDRSTSAGPVATDGGLRFVPGSERECGRGGYEPVGSAVVGEERTCGVGAVRTGAGGQLDQAVARHLVDPLQPRPTPGHRLRTGITAMEPAVTRLQPASLYPAVVGRVAERCVGIGGSNHRRPTRIEFTWHGYILSWQGSGGESTHE